MVYIITIYCNKKMEYLIIIYDKDNDDTYVYQFAQNMLLRDILESYTIDGRKIEYKDRYMYSSYDGEVSTPLNDLNKTLLGYNLLHDDTEVVNFIISSTPNLFKYVESKALALKF